MNNLKAGAALLLLIALIFVLNTKFGSAPPLGKFFDPDAGFWANAETSVPGSEELVLEDLREEVSVVFDERRVPHIFAGNDHDLYYALGYVVARDRLFQMELQTYDAAGRLSEFFGERSLNRDRTTRRWGMPYGAEKALEFVKQDTGMFAIYQAYSDGVNAYINSLEPADYPLEYKILDFEPEAWGPVKTLYLLKNMTRTLAAGNQDVRTSNTLRYFGEDFVDKFFTQDPGLLDPIIPRSRVWDFEAQVPEAPDTIFVPAHARDLDPFPMPEGVGSNNWAVSGSKTESGYPILANDPHLSLTLPSIWYEVQLNAPGINTYGVTLAGAPGVVIGFNEDVAWGVTNVGSDVLDWYEIRFRDDSMQEYWHDGEWKPTTIRIEEIKVREAETVSDTVIYTHHGPVTKVESRTDEEADPVYHAMRWIAHEASNEMKTFYELNRASDYQDFVEALRHYVAPAQNFVFASNEGDIALWVNGKFPNKWKHQGRTVSDGTDPAYDWQGWIPRDHVPHIVNPERGFVSSANQESAAPNYPYYLDDDYAPFERGKRINDRLSEMERITVRDMQGLQMDNYSYHAATILPQMLQWVMEEELTKEELEKLDILRGWDYFNDAEKKAPGIFRWWWSRLYYSVFEDEMNSTDALLRWPPRDRVTEVLKAEPGFAFIDNVNTEQTETIEELATSSFKEALQRLENTYGAFGPGWDWGRVINNDIGHIAYIPGMGKENLYSGGSSESVNATRGEHGPSWRMVVELGPEVKGYGVYPGGASGNPGSPNYDEMVESWRTGEFFELEFMKQVPDDYLFKLSMRPGN